MYIHEHGTKFRRAVDILLGMHNHEMDIHRLLQCLSYRRQYRETERDVRDKLSVHDVEMQPISFATVNHLYVSVKMQEIRCKQ